MEISVSGLSKLWVKLGSRACRLGFLFKRNEGRGESFNGILAMVVVVIGSGRWVL